MSNDKKHAKWLHKDGKRSLYHGDDVDAALRDGWQVIDGNRANGEPWNPTDEEAIAQLDDAADVIREGNEHKAEKAKKEADAAEKARAAAAKAAPEIEPEPALRVQVVEPPKKTTKK